MIFDLTLVYDREARCCDLALKDNGDLLIDDTSITAVLLSVGLARAPSLRTNCPRTAPSS
ncbi:hypothetical protein [Amorphus sp. MBR-141]